MNKKNRLAGRFLPSRVYARWTWTVRFGLCALPLVLFLVGSVVVYLQAPRYQSKVVFQYVGKRPLSEAVALLKSGNVMDRAVDATNLNSRLEVDKGTAIRIASESVVTSVDPASGMITSKVTSTSKEISRDLAENLPKALESYEASLATQAIYARLSAAERAATDAGDEAESKHQALAKVIAVLGDQPTDPVDRLDVDSVRADWEKAGQKVVECQELVSGINREMATPGKWVVVHTIPQISYSPVKGETDETMGQVVLRSLGTGLAFALVVPYLLEFAFPRRARRRPVVSKEWSELPGVPEHI